MNEIELMKELAGTNTKSRRDLEREWAEKNLKNQNNTVEPEQEFLNSDIKTDKSLENVANRLNSLLGSDFSSSIKIERL